MLQPSKWTKHQASGRVPFSTQQMFDTSCLDSGASGLCIQSHACVTRTLVQTQNSIGTRPLCTCSLTLRTAATVNNLVLVSTAALARTHLVEEPQCETVCGWKRESAVKWKTKADRVSGGWRGPEDGRGE